MRKTHFFLLSICSALALLVTAPVSAAVSKTTTQAWTQRLNRAFGVPTFVTPFNLGHTHTNRPEDWSQFSLARTQLDQFDQLDGMTRTAPEQDYDQLALAEISPKLDDPSADRLHSGLGRPSLFPLADSQPAGNSRPRAWRRYTLQPAKSGQTQTGPRRDWSRFLFAQAQTDQSGDAPTAAPAADEPINLEEIAKKMDNPLSNIWIIFNQNDTSLWHGAPNTGADAVINVTTIQPVLPVPLTRDWNL